MHNNNFLIFIIFSILKYRIYAILVPGSKYRQLDNSTWVLYIGSEIQNRFVPGSYSRCVRYLDPGTIHIKQWLNMAIKNELKFL
jgi:hypothetical protein